MSRSAGNRYVKAWSRRHYANKCCRDYWFDPQSPEARSKVCWFWVTGQGTPPTRSSSPMTTVVLWRTAVLYRLYQGSPGKQVRRLEQTEYTVHLVDDSAGRSNVAIDAYDVGCRLGRQCTIQSSFGDEEPCLLNQTTSSNLYTILATATWTISVQCRKPPRSYRKMWTSLGPAQCKWVTHPGRIRADHAGLVRIRRSGNRGFSFH